MMSQDNLSLEGKQMKLWNVTYIATTFTLATTIEAKDAEEAEDLASQHLFSETGIKVYAIGADIDVAPVDED